MNTARRDSQGGGKRCCEVSHLLPVGGHFRQVEGLTEIHQIQHILLEAASTKTWTVSQRRRRLINWLKMYTDAHLKHPLGLCLTYAGLEELAPYSLIHTNCLGYLLHIGSCGFAQSADTVDAADSLCQESIGCLHKHTCTIVTNLDCAYDFCKNCKGHLKKHKENNKASDPIIKRKSISNYSDNRSL